MCRVLALESQCKWSVVPCIRGQVMHEERTRLNECLASGSTSDRIKHLHQTLLVIRRASSYPRSSRQMRVCFLSRVGTGSFSVPCVWVRTRSLPYTVVVSLICYCTVLLSQDASNFLNTWLIACVSWAVLHICWCLILSCHSHIPKNGCMLFYLFTRFCTSLLIRLHISLCSLVDASILLLISQAVRDAIACRCR